MSNARRKSTGTDLARAETVFSSATPKVKTDTAVAVAREFASGTMTQRERVIAAGILRLMARDIEVRVRQAVARHIKACPYIPEDLARALANDVETVALPIIQYASVLGEADLIAIIDSGSVDKQIAVAKRKTVSEPVSDALVDAGNAKVVGTLLANHGAEIAERSYGKVLDRFAGDARIQELMVERPTLPLATTERLIASVSIELRERVLSRHGFDGALADELIRHGREGALTRSVAADRKAAEVEGLIDRLKGKGDLTPTLVLRALCEGDLNLFEAAMAAMAEMSIDNTRAFLHQRGPGGLRMVFRNTGMPQPVFRPIQLAIEEVGALRAITPEAAADEISGRIVERLVTEYEGLPEGGLEPLMSELSRRILGDTPGAAKRKPVRV
jgi:uncharacterized protein (DUF2336 family)